MTLKAIDEAARMWNKTRSPQYKEKWYKLVREYGKDINTTNSSVRRNTGAREVQFGTTNGNRRMLNVR